MSPENPRAKLAQLCAIEGFDNDDALFAAGIGDSVSPAICCNPNNPECDYTAEMEPDQDRGWCEPCCANTVVAALVLGELIDEPDTGRRDGPALPQSLQMRALRSPMVGHMVVHVRR